MMTFVKVALIAPLVAAVALTGARGAREQAKQRAVEQVSELPYAPSPSTAPIMTLGFRELAADLLFVRMAGYFGSADNDAAGIAGLAEAIVALDPQFRRAYEFGAIAMTAAKRGVDNSIHLRAIKLLESAGRVYPTDWRFPNLAGQIYMIDLQTDDPAQRRTWDESGQLLLESAARKPHAPAEAGVRAAFLQSRLGKKQRAVDSLRELLLITDDAGGRDRILAKLAEIADDDADEIAAELLEARKAFEAEARRERPALPLAMYLMIGPRPAPGFDLAELATGGADVIGSEPFERLEPIIDEPVAVPAPAPAPPPAPGAPSPP